jgi:hypothetical protein
MSARVRSGLLVRFISHAPLVIPSCRHLFAQWNGLILYGIHSCRLVLRDVAGLGRSVGWVALVVRSVKLVHQCIDTCEAGTFSWRRLPLSDTRRSCPARIDPQREAARFQNLSVAGCLFDLRWFTSRTLCFGDMPHVRRLHIPLTKRVKLRTGNRHPATQASTIRCQRPYWLGSPAHP